MPRLNKQGQALMGIGNQIVSIDGRTIDTESGGARWYKDGIIYANNANGSKLIYYSQTTGKKVVVSNKGATAIAANPNSWAAFIGGIEGVRVNGDVVQYPNSSLGDGAVDAEHLLMMDVYQSYENNIRDIVTNNLYKFNYVSDVRAYKEYFTVASNGQTFIQHYDSPIITKARTFAPGTASVVWNGKIWFFYNTSDRGTVFHPFDSTYGYVIPNAGFNPDVVMMDNGKIRLAASSGPGELPNELQLWEEEEVVALPLQDLSRLIEHNYGPFSRKIWAAPFYQHSVRYGNDAQPIGNATLIVEPNVSAPGFPCFASKEAVSTVDKNFLIGYWCSGSDVSSLIQEYNAFLTRPELPIIAYLDSRAWPSSKPSEFKDNRTWLGIQCYRRTGESYDSFKGEMELVLDRVSSYNLPIMLITQAYDNNGTISIDKVIELQPLFDAWVKKYFVIGILPFSSMRPGGYNNYPALRSEVTKLLAPAARPNRNDYWTPDMTLVKPEVTVLNWTLDELKNGREFNFEDRMNPGFGARVWVENKSIYAEFRNPKGMGRTGATREVKECMTIPPIQPPPIPPINPPVTSISKVRVDGLVFKNEDNSIFSWKGFSSFLLLRRLLEGDETGVRSYLKGWQALGYNVARVFSQVNWTGSPGPGLNPRDYPNYWNGLGKLINICAEYGIYVEFVHHTYAYDLTQMAEWSKSCRDFTGLYKNVFNEIANEPPVNGIDIDSLVRLIDTSKFVGPWATGQYDPTALPSGTYCTAHTARDEEWPRKAKWLLEYREGGGPNDNSDPAMLRPIIGDEPIGGADFNIPGRRSNVPSDFFAYASLAQLYGAGSTYHHESGLNSIMPDGVELECAKAFIDGINSVNPNFQVGEYSRVGLTNSPIKADESLRTYAMILGNKATVVRVRPTGPFEVADGWVVTGSVGTTIYLQRS